MRTVHLEARLRLLPYDWRDLTCASPPEDHVPDPESPLQRSIGLTGLIWWIIAIAAMIALGAAFSAGRYAMGTAAGVFMVTATVLGYRARRAR